MTVALETSQRASRPFLTETELLHLKTWLRPVDECLWAKLQDQLSDLDRIQRDSAGDAARDSELIRDCRKRIRMAKWCIERQGHAHAAHDSGFRKRLTAWARRFRWPATEDNTLFWHLAHSADEDLLLLLPVEEAAARGLEIKSLFERNIQQPATRRAWLGDGGNEKPLVDAVTTLNGAHQGLSPEGTKVRHARQVLRRALHEVNEQTDYSFRQLAVNMLMRAWSGLALFVLLVSSVLMLQGYLGQDAGKEFPPVFLFLGAAGAVLANLMSKDAFMIAQGPARRYLFYYLFAKPVEGAFAAFTLILFLRSELFLPRIESATPFTNLTLALAAGFAAEKVFGATINKVLGRLAKTAEKTETSPHIPEGSSEEAV